jgi:hypothetical protein
VLKARTNSEKVDLGPQLKRTTRLLKRTGGQSPRESQSAGPLQEFARLSVKEISLKKRGIVELEQG